MTSLWLRSRGDRTARPGLSRMGAMSRKPNTARIPWRALVGDQDPDEWLEATRAALLFRSHCAMHQAIAGATDLGYHTVHKCMSGSRRPRRIPAAIADCLKGWLNCLEEGTPLEVPDEFRAVPAEDMLGLLPALLEKFGSKSAIYEAVGERTGVQPTTVRRYFYDSDRLRAAPLAVYRVAKELADTPQGRTSENSYLTDDRTRQVAHELSERCRTMLMLWKEEDDPFLELEYRQLRRALITTIKEGSEAVPEGALA